MILDRVVSLQGAVALNLEKECVVFRVQPRLGRGRARGSAPEADGTQRPAEPERDAAL